MRVVTYSRVSTDGQEKDGTSLETQESACLEHAGAAGWEVVAQERDAVSGASLDRPGLARVRELVRSRQVDGVLCYAVDRLSRDQNHIGILFDEAKTIGVRLEFVTENFEDTSVGRFILSVGAFVAELEREKILERTTRGKTARARSGRIPQATGKGIYGYVYDAETGKRRVHPEQGPVVARIFETFAAGSSVSSIARELTEELIPSHGGGQWHPLTVRRVLLNETYTGRTVYRRTKVRHVHDPLTGKKRRVVKERDQSEWIEVPDATPGIVPSELFTRVQRLLSAPERKLRGRPSQEYVLSSRTRCMKCGSPVVGQTLQKGRYSYYRCRDTYTSNAEVKCDSAYIRKEVIERSIREALVTVLTDPDRLSEAAREHFSEDTDQASAVDDARALRRLDEKRTRLLDLYVDGHLPREIYEARNAQLQEELRMIAERTSQGAKARHINPATLPGQLSAIAEHVRKWAENATSEDFVLLAQVLDLRILASPERARATINVPVSESVQNMNLVTIARTWA